MLALLLFRGKKFDTNRRWNGHQIANLRQFAGGLIDLKHSDIVGVLIAGNDIAASGVDAKIPRRSAERFLVAGSR
jgi:hypothetical protein